MWVLLYSSAAKLCPLDTTPDWRKKKIDQKGGRKTSHSTMEVFRIAVLYMRKVRIYVVKLFNKAHNYRDEERIKPEAHLFAIKD